MGAQSMQKTRILAVFFTVVTAILVLSTRHLRVQVVPSENASVLPQALPAKAQHTKQVP